MEVTDTVRLSCHGNNSTCHNCLNTAYTAFVHSFVNNPSEVYADHISIQAASDLYKVKLMIYHSITPKYIDEIIPYHGPPKATVRLGNVSQIHYMCFLPQPSL